VRSWFQRCLESWIGEPRDGGETASRPEPIALPPLAEDASQLIQQGSGLSPAFALRLEVDHADRTFRGGDELNVTVTSGEPGYLYLLDCVPSGEVRCLFPNRVQKDNRIRANQPVQIPSGGTYHLRIGPPYGREVLRAIVVRQPLDSLEMARLLAEESTALDTGGVKAIFLEMRRRQFEAGKPGVSAEQSLEILTVDPG
jgi:hypothetical protein